MPNKFMITGIAIAVLIIGSVWYVSSLKDTISEQESIIATLNSDKDKLKLELALEKTNVNRLKEDIVDQNEKILALKESNDVVQIKLDEWKAKSNEDKYRDLNAKQVIDKTNNPTEDLCKDFIDITNNIKEIKYEDL